MVFPLTQPASKQHSDSNQTRKWMCQRIAQFLGTSSALGANTFTRFVQSSRKVKIYNGQVSCERADKELQAIVTLGVGEEVFVTIALPPKDVARKHSCARVSEQTSLTSHRTCQSGCFKGVTNDRRTRRRSWQARCFRTKFQWTQMNSICSLSQESKDKPGFPR